MFNLKLHPFEVSAYFKLSLVLTYSFNSNSLKDFIPECLELDTLNGDTGFMAAAFVQTENLRPKIFPEILGEDFILIGYRIFVRYKTSYGKRLRGLYILKSETDKIRMKIGGNLFTNYNYSKTDIKFSESSDLISIFSEKSGINIKAEVLDGYESLPAESPFKDIKEARRFSGPLPFTFSYLKDSNEMLIVEGVRSNWKPKPVKIIESEIKFINSIDSGKGKLANAFLVKDTPYYWKKGIKDKILKRE